MNATYKHWIEELLCGSGVTALGRFLAGRRILVLAYHNVIPDFEEVVGEESLHLAVSDFVEHLDLLASATEVISVADVLGRDIEKTGRYPCVAITFDDAYRGVVRFAIPELAKRELPATIFVSPGLLGDHTFWWDGLASSFEGDEWQEFRESALREHQGKGVRIKRAAERVGRKQKNIPRNQRSATEEELQSGVTEPGITVASHSWTHPNLPLLTDSNLEEEIYRPAKWLSERFEDSFLPVFAFPYGLSNSVTCGAVHKAGYDGAFTTNGRWLSHSRPRMKRYDLPRYVVPKGLSAQGFELRISGFPVS